MSAVVRFVRPSSACCCDYAVWVYMCSVCSDRKVPNSVFMVIVFLVGYGQDKSLMLILHKFGDLIPLFGAFLESAA